MPSNKPTVGVAGANGKLGIHIINALISENFRPNFGSVVALVRESAPQYTKDLWQRQGVIVRIYNEKNMVESLAGIDILINALNSKGHLYKDAIAKALPLTKVCLYFPSEFGVDHVVHEFNQVFWDAKKRHYDDVQKLDSIRVSRVYVGLFTEDSIGSWFGFNTKTGVYECVGSPDAKISFTSREDSGTAMAALASLSLSDVPEEVHIAGDTRSFNEIAKIMEDSGAGPITIQQLDLEEFKGKLIKEPVGSPAPYLRFLVGEGKIDHRKERLGCDNDLVNKDETNWKWTTLTHLAERTGGKPNA